MLTFLLGFAIGMLSGVLAVWILLLIKLHQIDPDTDDQVQQDPFTASIEGWSQLPGVRK